MDGVDQPTPPPLSQNPHTSTHFSPRVWKTHTYPNLQILTSSTHHSASQTEAGDESYNQCELSTWCFFFCKSLLKSIIKLVMSLTSGSILKLEKHLVMGAAEIYLF